MVLEELPIGWGRRRAVVLREFQRHGKPRPTPDLLYACRLEGQWLSLQPLNAVPRSLPHPPPGLLFSAVDTSVGVSKKSSPTADDNFSLF